MAGGYKQQPGSAGGTEVRKDGKRVAGQLKFQPPGAGGSNPAMKPRDLDFIPKSVEERSTNPQVLTFMIGSGQAQ